ncbi:putative protein S-acyltransferase [Helianthus debilis subsp. tardiflorus]
MLNFNLFFYLFSIRAAYKGFANTIRLLLFWDVFQGKQDKEGNEGLIELSLWIIRSRINRDEGVSSILSPKQMLWSSENGTSNKDNKEKGVNVQVVSSICHSPHVVGQIETHSDFI